MHQMKFPRPLTAYKTVEIKLIIGNYGIFNNEAHKNFV